VFTQLITDLGRRRDEATAQAMRAEALLADVEALHEPDVGGDCPTCMTEAPCLTLRMLNREVTFHQACDAVRGRTIDLVAMEEETMRRPVPSLSDLLAQPSRGLDRFFDALHGTPRSGDAA
jgi:hypothetical protein